MLLRCLAVLVLLASPLASSYARCPLTQKGERPEDCPWAEIAREMGRLGDQNEPVLPVLHGRAAHLVKQLASDSRRKIWKTLWGKSINFDEYAHGVIVHPEILEALGTLLGMEMDSQQIQRDKIVHAGLEHTYGYLFSVLKTPFGYKRARWVQKEIDQGFGLPEGTLSPTTSDGTLFSNVTYFLGRIALENNSKSLVILESGKAGVAKAVAEFPYQKLKWTRLEETIQLPGRKVVLRTDFVPFLYKGRSNTHLLIYSTYDQAANPAAQLITAFPVQSAFVDKALAKESLGENRPIITRYNAFVPGITGESRQILGNRKSKKKNGHA